MESLTQTLNDTSSDRAQRQLDALRAAVEVRLSALEAVLADPSRGESLEGLVLDLARVATEEARATTLKAILDVKLEADARVAQAREAVQEALDQERIVGSDLRRSLEQARQRMNGLEQEQLGQLRKLRQELEAEIGRERESAAGLERGAAEARKQLEQERAVSADLRLAFQAERQTNAQLGQELEAERAARAELGREVEGAHALSTTLAREKADAWAAQEALSVDLARERDGAARLHRLNAEMQAQLDAERAAAAELRRATEHTEQQLANVVNDKDQTSANHDETQRELTAVRIEAEAIRLNLEAAGARLEMLDAERLRADRARKDLETRLEALVVERDALAAELQTARQGNAPAQANVQPTTPAAVRPAPPAQPHPLAAPQRTQGSTSGDEEWGAVRLAVRYAFRQPITIQINGDVGLLVDLSVAGCQLVSTSSVRPNQVVKVLLPTGETSLVCTGKVMWARFEPRAASGSLGYRAGIQFTKPDQAALEAFIATSRFPPQ
jgi:hypothetical protein